MRLISIVLVSVLVASASIAQRVDCPNDVLLYPVAKTSTVLIQDSNHLIVDTLRVDPTDLNTLWNGVYQLYEAPQNIIVSGARFYAFKPDNNLDTVRVTVELRYVNKDSIPTGPALASETILIETPDSLTAPLSDFMYEVNWTPVVVNKAYVVTITLDPLGDAVSFIHNHVDNGDGAQEWLSGVREGVTWRRAYDISIGNQVLDADFLILPFVDYDLNASFINDPECLFDELGDTVQFFNDGSKIVDSRMYNSDLFFNLGVPQVWDFGDGSSLLFQQDPDHFYPSNGPFAPNLTVRLRNWQGQMCSDDETQIIKPKPDQDFVYTTNNLEVDFENKTLGLYSSISYDYGDGNSSSNEEDPKHKYAEPGTYWVCQSMMTSCGLITHCENVAVATNTALNCGKDSVKWAFARATHVERIRLKNTTPNRLLGVGQRFDVNQSIIVHGFTFYANHEGLFRDAYPVQCNIYKEGSNTLPDGPPLATSTVRINKNEVDSNYSDTVRYTAIFDRPVNIKEDYILTVEYDSTVPVQISLNGYLQGDGQGELRASGKINDTTWVTSASVGLFNINGNAVNADMIFEPLIEYNLDANFEYDKDCLDMRDGNETVSFTNKSSEIVRNEFYNQIPFYGSSVEGYEWDFGDSTNIVNSINPTYQFTGTGPFDVTLTIKVEGWTTQCQSSQTLNVPVYPTGGFSYDQVTSQVNFIDSSHNADEYWWTFDDGTFSTLANPVHYFTSIGKFEVCQYVSNVCGSDTICDSISINVVGIPERITDQLSVFPNPATDNLTIRAQNLDVQELTIKLFDLSGREVRSFSSIGGYIDHQMYVGDLARGSYLMKIIADEHQGTRKLILSK